MTKGTIAKTKTPGQYEQEVIALSHDCNFALFYKKTGATYRIYRNVPHCRPALVKTTTRPGVLAHYFRREVASMLRPRSNPAQRDEAANAADLVRRFTGREVDENEVTSVKRPASPKALAHIGNIFAIEYLAERDGKVYRFRHVFKQKSRPALAVTPDGSNVSMIGGSWKFTEDGFVDS